MVQRGAVDHTDLLEPELRELLAVVRKTGLAHVTPERPSLPLNVTDLLVNARDEVRIGAELIKELQSADRVDLLCSFLKWSDYRQLRRPLQELVQRGGQVRVLTTCYLGATDGRVLRDEALKCRLAVAKRRTVQSLLANPSESIRSIQIDNLVGGHNLAVGCDSKA